MPAPTKKVQIPATLPTAVVETPKKPKGPVGEQTPCSFNISNSQASEALHTLSLQTGVNLVLLSRPQDKLTLKLTDVPFIDILRHICAMTGMTYLKVGTAYVVADPDKLK